MEKIHYYLWIQCFDVSAFVRIDGCIRREIPDSGYTYPNKCAYTTMTHCELYGHKFVSQKCAYNEFLLYSTGVVFLLKAAATLRLLYSDTLPVFTSRLYGIWLKKVRISWRHERCNRIIRAPPTRPNSRSEINFVSSTDVRITPLITPRHQFRWQAPLSVLLHSRGLLPDFPRRSKVVWRPRPATTCKQSKTFVRFCCLGRSCVYPLGVGLDTEFCTQLTRRQSGKRDIPSV